MNLEYTTLDVYLESKSKSIGKIATYDLIIEGLEQTLLKSTASGHIVQYEMDDGQMKVRTAYRNVKELIASMEGLIRLRQYYINRANGRVTRLVGGKL